MRPSQEMQGPGSSYPSMVDKTFKNAVMELIQSQYGSLGGGNRLSDMLASDVSKLADRSCRKNYSTGQLVLTAVCVLRGRGWVKDGKHCWNPSRWIFIDKESMIDFRMEVRNSEKGMARTLERSVWPGGCWASAIYRWYICALARQICSPVENETNTVLPYRGQFTGERSHKAKIVELSRNSHDRHQENDGSFIKGMW